MGRFVVLLKWIGILFFCVEVGMFVLGIVVSIMGVVIFIIFVGVW